MTERNARPQRAGTDDRRRQGEARKRYETPRLIDYGRIAKLTQTGGITTKDSGNMFRVGP